MADLLQQSLAEEVAAQKLLSEIAEVEALPAAIGNHAQDLSLAGVRG